MDQELRIQRCKHQHIAPFWKGLKAFGTWWRLYHNSEPGGSITVRGQTTELVPENIYLLPPGLTFTTDVTGDPQQFFIHFDINGPYERVQTQVYTIPLNETLQQQIELAKNELLPHPKWLTAKGNLHAMSIVALSMSQIPEGCVNVKPIDHRVADAIDRFRDEMSQSLNIAEMAKSYGLTESAFIRLFKKEVDQTPYSYLMQIRIEMARDLLLKSDLTINEIATWTGFSDRFHFSRVFKQLIGKSPAAYRKADVTPHIITT